MSNFNLTPAQADAYAELSRRGKMFYTRSRNMGSTHRVAINGARKLDEGQEVKRTVVRKVVEGKVKSHHDLPKEDATPRGKQRKQRNRPEYDSLTPADKKVYCQQRKLGRNHAEAFAFVTGKISETDPNYGKSKAQGLRAGDKVSWTTTKGEAREAEVVEINEDTAVVSLNNRKFKIKTEKLTLVEAATEAAAEVTEDKAETNKAGKFAKPKELARVCNFHGKVEFVRRDKIVLPMSTLRFDVYSCGCNYA